MKTTLYSIILVLCIGLFSIVSADQLDDAVSWMHDNELTIFDNKTDFQATRGLRRDEAAKFYLKFAQLLGKNTYVKTESECRFSDLNQAWSDLQEIIIESCKLGLFQGNQGRLFSPQDQLTNAQAVAVLMRLLTGPQSELGLSHRADHYYTQADGNGLIHNNTIRNKDAVASRGDVAVMIWQGNNMSGQALSHWVLFSSRRSYSYDSYNNIIQHTTYHLSGSTRIPKEKTNYSYDSYNNIIQHTTYHLSGSTRTPNHKIDSSYDSHNNKIQATDYSRNGSTRTPNHKIDSSYDSHNNKIQETRVKGDGSILITGAKSDYSYDSHNNKIQATYYSRNGSTRTPEGKTNSSYDSHNNQIQSITYYPRGSTRTPARTTEYSYDSHNNNIQYTTYGRDGSTRTPYHKIDSSYDLNNNKIQETYYSHSRSKSSRILKQKIDRSYDTKGNKIQELRLLPQ